jgi:hypothetical protein
MGPQNSGKENRDRAIDRLQHSAHSPDKMILAGGAPKPQQAVRTKW